MKIVRALFAAAVLAALILLVIYPAVAIDAAKTALEAWGLIVVPSLLPFFIGVNILNKTGIVNIIASLLSPLGRVFFGQSGYACYAFLAAAVSGCPTGARVLSSLKTQGSIDGDYAAKASYYTLMAGPMFILGTVAAGLLHNPSLGGPLFLSHLAGALLTGVMFKFYRRPKTTERENYVLGIKNACGEFSKFIRSQEFDASKIIEQSVTGSVGSLLLVGGLIVAFNVLLALLRASGALVILSAPLYPLCTLLGMESAMAEPLITGLFEMTTGVVAAAKANAGLASVLTALTFIMGFSGFSMIAQAKSVLSGAKIKAPLMLLAKLIQAFASVGVLKLLLINADISAAAFPPTYSYWALWPVCALSAALLVLPAALSFAKRRQSL